MIACVDCGYQSKRGNRHWDNCRLMLLEFARQEGAPNFEIAPIRESELKELEAMIMAMERLGARRGADGYFGKCVVGK